MTIQRMTQEEQLMLIANLKKREKSSDAKRKLWRYIEVCELCEKAELELVELLKERRYAAKRILLKYVYERHFHEKTELALARLLEDENLTDVVKKILLSYTARYHLENATKGVLIQFLTGEKKVARAAKKILLAEIYSGSYLSNDAEVELVELLGEGGFAGIAEEILLMYISKHALCDEADVVLVNILTNGKPSKTVENFLFEYVSLYRICDKAEMILNNLAEQRNTIAIKLLEL